MDTGSRRYVGNIYSEEQIKRVLTGSGVTIENEVGTDYIVFCPFHANNRTPAGEVDKVKGTFFCFSCHKISDLIQLVMHVSGRTYFESIRFIKNKESEIDLNVEIAKKLVVKPEYPTYDPQVITRLSLNALSSDRAKTYFNGRSILVSTMETFQLGYSEKQDMVTVPIHAPNGSPVGFVGRSIEGKEFKNTPGLPKGKVLFNLHRVKTADRVYVVESAFDALRLYQCGFSAVATLGSNVSNTQTDLLRKYFNDVVVIADNDEAGGNMIERLSKKLGHTVSSVQLDKKYKDIGDMPDDEIKKLNVSFDRTIAGMLQ